MKLKHLIYSICLAGMALTSCQKEDELENVVDTTSPYELDYLANSTDEIDQRRYEIYQTYGVPVFFDDVITEEVVGTDYKGDPIYKREKLDIAWDFYSKSPSASYYFEYIFSEDEEIDPELSDEEKAALEAELAEKKVKELADAHVALNYVETYLSMAGGTKPFSILLLRTLNYNGVKEFYPGFRTLYISNACSYPEPADQRMKSGEIINASVLPLVQKDEALVAEFETVSNENHYYNKMWQADLGETFSDDLKTFMNSPYYLKLSKAFDETALSEIVNYSHIYTIKWYWENYGMYVSAYPHVPSAEFALKYYNNMEAIKEVTNELVAIAAKYGFVGGGWSNDTTYSPTVSADIEAYVKTILQLGAGGFEARYGEYPLVMQKFNIMKDYIQNVLEVDINYNNVN